MTRFSGRPWWVTTYEYEIDSAGNWVREVAYGHEKFMIAGPRLATPPSFHPSEVFYWEARDVTYRTIRYY